MHHIISDGMSAEIFIRKMCSYYDKLRDEEIFAFRHDEGYSSFAKAENEKLNSGKYDVKKKYWINKVVNIEPLLLPTDFIDIHKTNGLGIERRYEISKETIESVSNAAMEQGVSLFIFFLSMFGVMLSKYTKMEKNIISVPFSYRIDEEIEETIGCFVSNMLFHFNIMDDDMIPDILRKVSRELVDVYSNINYPINRVIRHGNSSQQASGSSVFDVCFVYDKHDKAIESTLNPAIVDQDYVAFSGNLMFALNIRPDKNWIKILYKQEVFAMETIELMGKRYIDMIELVANNPDICVGDINLS